MAAPTVVETILDEVDFKTGDETPTNGIDVALLGKISLRIEIAKTGTLASGVDVTFEGAEEDVEAKYGLLTDIGTSGVVSYTDATNIIYKVEQYTRFLRLVIHNKHTTPDENYPTITVVLMGQTAV